MPMCVFTAKDYLPTVVGQSQSVISCDVARWWWRVTVTFLNVNDCGSGQGKVGRLDFGIIFHVQPIRSLTMAYAVGAICVLSAMAIADDKCEIDRVASTINYTGDGMAVCEKLSILQMPPGLQPKLSTVAISTTEVGLF